MSRPLRVLAALCAAAGLGACGTAAPANDVFDASKIGFAYVCGNQFKATNRGTAAVGLVWTVDGSAEQGSVSLPAPAAGMAPTEASFTTTSAPSRSTTMAGSGMRSNATALRLSKARLSATERARLSVMTRSTLARCSFYVHPHCPLSRHMLRRRKAWTCTFNS